MRALCGAIVAAGGLIGLGLTAVGYGLRFQGMHDINPNTGHLWGTPTMAYLLVVLFVAALIGLGIAFVGLMYHHERRFLEMMRERNGLSSVGVTNSANRLSAVP